MRVLAVSGLGWLGFTLALASPLPSPTPSFREPPSARPSSSSFKSVDKKTLFKEFQRAQQNELRAMVHRQSIEMKRLKSAQAAEFKEWNRKEAKARHEFLRQSHPGPLKRQYIQGFLKRRDAFLALQKSDRQRISADQQARRSSLGSDQQKKLKAFQQDLDQGVQPPASLWPPMGD